MPHVGGYDVAVDIGNKQVGRLKIIKSSGIAEYDIYFGMSVESDIFNRIYVCEFVNLDSIDRIRTRKVSV